MSTSTTNISLTKPAYTDSVDVGVINDNMDLIDQHIGTIESNVSSLSTASSSHGTSITALQNGKQDKLTPTSTSVVSNPNTELDLGVYYLDANSSNKPGTENYLLLVFPSNTVGNLLTQIAINPNGNNMFIRTYGNSQWYSWRKLLNENSQVKGSLDTSIALNAVTDSGWYWLQGNYTNNPHTGASMSGLLEVMRAGSALVVQRYTRFGGTDFTPIQVYERVYVTDSWKPWALVTQVSS